MKITSDNLISRLLFGNQDKKSSNGPLVDGSEIARLAKDSGGLKQAAIAASQQSGSDDAASIEITGPPEDVEVPDSEAAPPEDTAPTDQSGSNDDIRALAQRYVDLYEEKSGNDLEDSTEEVQRVDEVAEFYSQAGREGRLEELMSKLEQEA